MVSTSIQPVVSAAEPSTGSVELTADSLEYLRDTNEVLANGNVIIIHEDTTLYCDKVRFLQQEQIAHAEGNVRLVRGKSEVSGK